jgi:hypothetical protein
MTYSVGIDLECLNATLLEVIVSKTSLIARVVGDGVIVARRRDASFTVIVIEYPSGAPFYPRYSFYRYESATNGVYEKYIAAFGREYTVKVCGWRGPGQPFSEAVAEARSLPDDPVSHADVFEFPRSDYDLLAVFSDGVHTFTRPTVSETSRGTESIPLSEVLSELMAFKSMKGDFVARRCHAAFRSFAERGWEHSDDFSIAAVCDIREDNR